MTLAEKHERAKLMVKMRSEGHTFAAIGQRFGTSQPAAYQAIRRFRAHPKWMKRQAARNRTAMAIVKERKAGKTLQAIGRERGVSRERIRQIEKRVLGKSWPQTRREKNLELLRPFMGLLPLTRICVYCRKKSVISSPRLYCAECGIMVRIIGVLVSRLRKLGTRRSTLSMTAYLVRKHKITPAQVLKFYRRANAERKGN